MKTKILYSFCFIILYSPFILSSFAQGTAFSYQGRLNSGGPPANGSYDVTFSLFAANTGGVALAGPVTNPAVTVSNGLFTTTVNFGNVFTGTSNWLQIAVSTNGANAFSTLSPRQQLTPVPYAIYAANAGTVSGTIANSSLPPSPSFAGTVTANSFTGAGMGLTGLNSTNISGAFQQLTGTGGGGAQVTLDLTTYNTPANKPTARIQTTDETNFSSGFDFYTKIPGDPANGLASRLHIASDGRIGMGTTTPGSSLEVFGPESRLWLRSASSTAFTETAYLADGRAWNTGVGGSGVGNGLNSKYYIYDATAGQARLVVNTDGNVGIGTTSPNSLLTVNGTVTAANFSGSGSGLTNLNAATLGGLSNSNFWRLNGNGGTTQGINYLGTSDNRALELRVNGGRALLVQPTATVPNLIGGYSGNVVSNGFVGATIVGGGSSAATNRVGNDYATVLGGAGNTASGPYSIAMGYKSTASSDSSTAMGSYTTASAFVSTAMGFLTTASGWYSTAMGASTTASGIFSTAMGNDTTASGDYSTAMGNVARATNQGTFVWADSSSFTPFTSTANNQFLIRAAGGVGIGTATPVSALQVIGTVTATAFNPPSDRNLKENFSPVSPREVLEKVAALPISRWNFIGDAATPHIGPMAQDFHAAFALGTDERHIATVDADGVALAAIQGLNEKVESGKQKAETRMEQKDAEIAELRQELAELKELVQTLVEKK